ncbi:cysteine-rich repeat secretory protein 38 [Vitis vinifera]|uniref:Gnk2-homologous domain-containing protein n=1 Tax=Vitis vinifera TaxID=29760 RepID=D7TEP7_VITVI|eukprot:XP_003633310.1 PREDICTED: cysteine-rich repeat secretory protein 38 [Vitis vinifera]
MPFSRFASFLCLLSFLLLLNNAVGVDPLFHFCTGSEKFIDNGPYETNLNKLMDSLQILAPPTGFGKASVGLNADRSNGLALCRPDVSNTDCKACVTEASTEILKRCPDYKAAIIWYDNCLLKYSNMDFFGQVDHQKFYSFNEKNVSNPASFNQKTRELLSRLVEEAFVAPNMYATGEVDLEESKKLYGLVQCTRDLSTIDCKQCLDDAVSEVPNCCDGKEGGRVATGSCNIRYETYPFVKS